MTDEPPVGCFHRGSCPGISMDFSSAAPLEKWSPTAVSQPNQVRSMIARAKHGLWWCLHGKVPEKKWFRSTKGNRRLVLDNWQGGHVSSFMTLAFRWAPFYSIQSSFHIISGHFNSFSQQPSSTDLSIPQALFTFHPYISSAST